MTTKTKFSKIISLVLAVMMLSTFVFTIAACDDDSDKQYYDNETDKLVFSTQEVDKVFNPFFSTSATDSNVVGMTQIGMVGNDENGDVVYGDDEAVVAKDLEIITVGTPNVDQTTTYYFVLKNNVKFSNGSPLTMKDVLFNLYVYLDPAYTGSSTIYSTDIVGLQEYRTQAATEEEQEAFETKYKVAARARIDALIEATTGVLEKHMDEYIDEDTMVQYLADEWEKDSDSYANVVKDFQKTAELFREELENDYSNSRDSYTDQLFTDKEGNVYRNLLTTDVEMFLLNEGFITWSKDEAKLHSSLVADSEIETLKTWTQEQAINTVYNATMPDSVEEVLTYWNTSVTLYDFLTKEEMEADKPADGVLEFPNISGIKFANYDTAVTVNGNSYAVPQYNNSDGSVKDGYNEVLSITINNVDPKAIWNFAFAIAPLYYYSDEAHINSFSYAENRFGVEYKSQSFMENVVKNPDKIGVPVGAGPYAASKASGGLENVKSGDFYDKGVIYFERNPYYLMGPAKIKSVRYQVVAANSMLDALYTNQVDYAEPNALPETESELNGKKSEGYDYTRITTLGYGYIGINAGKIPNVYVRRAIMYAIDVSMCVAFYMNLAKPIYRSMSTESWAYPDGCVAYYPYIGDPVPEDYEELYFEGKIDASYYEYMSEHGKQGGDKLSEQEQMDFITWLMTDKAGYTIDGNGLYADNGRNECMFEFTIAGQETKHPAYSAMLKAAELLNKVGFNVTVKTDKDALKKLANGSLTVWAAAWGSTIDPDMYQVYHKDSTATSVLNWGYKQILANTDKYAYENERIGVLSELIEEARLTNDQTERAQIYSEALDIVMELAIELPTYQRNDLFAYNVNKIDASTFFTPASAFKGLTSDIHNISLVMEK